MAIDKDVENEYGATFKYHKLQDVRIVNDDKVGIQLVMTIFSWINKDARIAGKQPTARQCIIQHADFALTPFYALLKAKFPEFSSGNDDYDNSFKVENKDAIAQFVEQTVSGKLINRWQEEPANVEETNDNNTSVE